MMKTRVRLPATVPLIHDILSHMAAPGCFFGLRAAFFCSNKIYFRFFLFTKLKKYIKIYNRKNVISVRCPALCPDAGRNMIAAISEVS